MSSLERASELVRDDLLKRADAALLRDLLLELLEREHPPDDLADTLRRQRELLKRGAPARRELRQLRCTLRELWALRLARQLPDWSSEDDAVRERYLDAAAELDRRAPPESLGEPIDLDSAEGTRLGLVLGSLLFISGLVVAVYDTRLLLFTMLGGLLFGLSATRRGRVRLVHGVEATLQRRQSRSTPALEALRSHQGR